MMSLFNSFDLNFFKASMALPIVMGYILNSSTYFITPQKKLTSSVKKQIMLFFSSLKPKMFNKSMMTIFMSIMTMWMMANLLSVLPFIFSLTSQVSYVGVISLALWSSLMMFQLIYKFKGTISHWVPEGTPMALTLFLFMIEMVSNLIRPLTITVRLVANILAGHLLMILLSKLALKIGIMASLYVVLNTVELAVALIQAYIFATMATLYYSEV